MNLKNQQLQINFERAMKMLCEHVSISTEREKPQMMHSLRVGMYLFNNDYSDDVVIGGLLHDMLEWTSCSEEMIRDEFGQKVLDIVKANTKNLDIKDQKERQKDYVDRCAQVGDEALIVKASDTLDSYQYYVAIQRQKEIDRSVAIAMLIIKIGLKDKIVDELKKIV
ncbi:MAG: HD domain-containing protein [Candidatus Uhrbacteria bacterium]